MGLINLLRSITDETIGGAADALAQAMALVLVGVPISCSTGYGCREAPHVKKKSGRPACGRSSFTPSWWARSSPLCKTCWP